MFNNIGLCMIGYEKLDLYNDVNISWLYYVVVFLLVLLCNVCVIVNKIDEFECVCNLNFVDVVCVIEIWFMDIILDFVVSMKNYVLFCCDCFIYVGGIVVYINCDIFC